MQACLQHKPEQLQGEKEDEQTRGHALGAGAHLQEFPFAWGRAKLDLGEKHHPYHAETPSISFVRKVVHNP